MPLETFPNDSAELLDSDEAVTAYVEAAFETGDAAFIAQAVGVAARARGMRHRRVGLTAELADERVEAIRRARVVRQTK